MANQLANFWGKKRANSSNIWDHFGFRIDARGVLLDKIKAVCKHCFVEVKYTGGSTTNLTSHYNNHHMDEARQKANSAQPSIQSAFGSTRKYGRGSSHYLMLQQKLIEHIVADMKPFNTVESVI